MKKIKAYLMVASLAFFGATTFNACTDACKDVTCVNGECVDGDCDCDTGYEGTDCSTEQRAKFIGSSNLSGTVACPVSGNGSFPSTSFTMANSSGDVSKFTITGAGLTLTATLDGSNSFVISNQTVGNFDYTGSGSLSGTTFNLTLNEYDSSVPETCIYTLSGTLN